MELLISFLSILIVFLNLVTPSQSQNNDSYFYDACAPFTCGNVKVGFPFSSSESFCSPLGFEIGCVSSTPTLTISNVRYQVNEISFLDPFIIVVSDIQLTQNLKSNTCVRLQDHFLPEANFSPFQHPSWVINLNFSLCSGHGELPLNFTQVAVNYSEGCAGNESFYVFLPFNSMYDGDSMLPEHCVHAALPAQAENLRRYNLSHRDDMFRLLNDGFPLQWNDTFTGCPECEEEGGRCGYNRSTGNVRCFCKSECSQRGHLGTGRPKAWKIIVAVVVPVTFVLLAGLVAFIKFRSSFVSIWNNLSIKSISRSGNTDVEEFMKSYRSMLPTEFSYTSVRKITQGLKEQLGEGGYGNVYKGKLPNGQLVAAKILEKSKNNGRDFVNEVATIGRIHHVNIIRLLGFCCDGSHRALIYEFMPKGSLGDLISKEEIIHTIGVPRLLKIAIGIARGIEYLHQGCERRILHLDIKPHNVLLDNNFHPKISDFGLAKSYSHKDSTVTLTGARGTFGYIAPEVFMRNLGGVSHKSDVYSYGMLLLEMAMGKKNERPETQHSSKEYFPDWIYDQLNQWSGVEGEDVVIEEDTGISKKMVMVGLWCIQTSPVNRPSISTVLEMLTGEVERIEMPPKPVLFSLPRQQQLEYDISYTDSGGEGSLHTSETGVVTLQSG